MDIHSKKGTKVMFTGKGGYDNNNNYANDFLVIGNTYTVDFTKVGNFNTIVILEEIPGKIFNSVHFDNIKEIETETDWDQRFLDLAEYIGNWSKDRSTKVGAVIVDDDKRIVSTGYNGFCRNSDDKLDYKHERPAKYFFTAHAEANSIYHAAKHGVSVNNCIIYVTLFPCAECCKAIIQSGIKKIVTYEPDWTNKNWFESFKYSKIMMEESGINIKFIVNK